MKRLPILVFIALTLLSSYGAAPVYAREPSIYIVQPGDTLIRISARHGVSVSQLARANGLRWNSWVYVGQRLTIPGHTATSTQPSGARANGLRWYSWVYVGQRLTIPGGTPAPVPQDTSSERWIDVNLSTQTLTAYVGNGPVYTVAVSTGLPNTPTPVGQFRIWIKLKYDDMRGPGYYLRDVPYVMYFYKDYGLHGTYWHDNFGTPMSHGCVNLSSADAEWLFNWASVGTRVITHY